mgnify:CR=1 FL=1
MPKRAAHHICISGYESVITAPSCGCKQDRKSLYAKRWGALVLLILKLEVVLRGFENYNLPRIFMGTGWSCFWLACSNGKGASLFEDRVWWSHWSLRKGALLPWTEHILHLVHYLYVHEVHRIQKIKLSSPWGGYAGVSFAAMYWIDYVEYWSLPTWQ